MRYSVAHVIVNPAAGRGRAARMLPQVLTLLRSVGHAPAVHYTTRSGSAVQIARTLSAAAGAVAVLAGDGTLNEVVNGLHDRDRPILLLPAGTGNDTARSLGLPIDPLAIVAAPLFREVAIDLGEIAGRLFVNSAGIGLDGNVCRLVRARGDVLHGRAGYVLAFLACALNVRASLVRIESAEVSCHARSLLITFANGQYYGGGMRIAPAADLQDGLLDICTVLDLDRLDLVRTFPRVYAGTHVSHPCFRMWRARAVAISGVRPVTVHADGEVVGRLSTDPAAPTSVSVTSARQRFLVTA